MRLGAFRKLGHLRYGSGRIVLVDYQTGSEKSIYMGPTVSNVRFSELDDPEVGFISAENLGDGPLFIPSGWLISGLKQSRMVLQDSIVDVGETVMLSVVCCEKKRWGQQEAVSSFNRAPANVLAYSRLPAVGQRERQQHVWDSVAEIEGRTHERETNSLPQIMQEEIRTNQKFDAIAKEIYGFGVSNRANGYFFENEGDLKAFEIFESFDLFAESGLKDITNLLIDVKANPTSSRSDITFDEIVGRMDLRNSHLLEQDDNFKLVEMNIDNFSTQALLNSNDQLVHLSGVKLPVLL